MAGSGPVVELLGACLHNPEVSNTCGLSCSGLSVRKELIPEFPNYWYFLYQGTGGNKIQGVTYKGDPLNLKEGDGSGLLGDLLTDVDSVTCYYDPNHRNLISIENPLLLRIKKGERDLWFESTGNGVDWVKVGAEVSKDFLTKSDEGSGESSTHNLLEELEKLSSSLFPKVSALTDGKTSDEDGDAEGTTEEGESGGSEGTSSQGEVEDEEEDDNDDEEDEDEEEEEEEKEKKDEEPGASGTEESEGPETPHKRVRRDLDDSEGENTPTCDPLDGNPDQGNEHEDQLGENVGEEVPKVDVGEAPSENLPPAEESNPEADGQGVKGQPEHEELKEEGSSTNESNHETDELAAGEAGHDGPKEPTEDVHNEQGLHHEVPSGDGEKTEEHAHDEEKGDSTDLQEVQSSSGDTETESVEKHPEPLSSGTEESDTHSTSGSSDLELSGTSTPVGGAHSEDDSASKDDKVEVKDGENPDGTKGEQDEKSKSLKDLVTPKNIATATAAAGAMGIGGKTVAGVISALLPLV